MTNEDRERLMKAYKRASFGLALGALLWTVALVVKWTPEEGRATWLIPIGIAAMSVLCFSRYNQYRGR